MSRISHAPLDSAIERELRRQYLFAALSDEQWQRLVRQIRALQLPAGQRLFDQDAPAEAFFVVCSGTLKLFRESPSGLEKIMRLTRRGQSFAESVLFSEPPRYPVHAQAVTNATLAAVPREPYLALLRESFDTCRAVMAQMVRRIHAHWDEIEALSLRSSRARVARYLLELAPAMGSAGAVKLPTPKALIAGQLGLAPETLSRGLRTLSDRHLISVQGQVIEILDPQGLSRCANQ